MRTLVAAALAAAASAHPTFDAAEFKAVGPTKATESVTFTAALPVPAHKVAALDNHLMVVSDPDSADYGKWLSQEEILNYIAPEPAHREAVREWVTSTGAKCMDWPSALRCSAPAAAVEKLLSTKLTTYQHVPKDGKLVHRIAPGQTWTPPAHLAGKLEFVSGLVEFPTVRARHGRIHSHTTTAEGRSLQSTYDAAVTVETLSHIYEIPVNNRPQNSQSTSAPAEFQADASWTTSDIQVFATENGVAPWNASNIVGVYGGVDTEATLDVQFMGGLSANNPQWYWTEADWMYEFVQHLASLPTGQIPLAFSMSWGWSESDQCTIDATASQCATASNSTAYVQATNVGFAAAAARGISMLVSSGDSGAHGRTDGGCSATQTKPVFPAASPYVTAVGATQLINPVPLSKPSTPYCANSTNIPCAAGGTEIVCSTATGALIVSGGGFSNVASTPAWQQAAVAAYLKAAGNTLPGPGNFNPGGRGYPDVAALGHNYIIVQGGSNMQVDGTSCSAPVWGGLVNLFNAHQLSNGKSPLGFLNPLLYKLAAKGVFNDVTQGNNTCTEDGCTPGCTGFTATAGWDAATGFGTPNFPALRTAISNMI